jgi:2,3-dihydro-2,3-dihydroxybenzoate dehydrogenase
MSKHGRTAQFQAKIALVTGAASGIGRAVALELLERGARVVGLDRDREVLAKAGPHHLSFFPRVVNVNSVRRVAQLVQDVEREVGPIDFLVNAAGVLVSRPLLETTMTELGYVFATNTAGSFIVTSAVARGMRERRAGSIVTVSSNAGAVPRVGLGAYCASKAAATMLTKCFALELAPFGIRCNVVSPGSTDSPMLDALLQGRTHAEVIEGDLTKCRLGIPLGKVATPQDVAYAALFLLSDESGHTTGQDLRVDGGATP